MTGRTSRADGIVRNLLNDPGEKRKWKKAERVWPFEKFVV
ncbi:hypothetical protein IB211_00966 [Intestinimonas butyriciproducens]|uniref:Uncharacterized protein n=1 Tax=Intestinimonas butyriciproducens TaxID=1297617 RepID=A0A0S2W274_9FIRM|nr:hypothetical protein IB211_00966 [Intestinimonas butyriciproducens]